MNAIDLVPKYVGYFSERVVIRLYFDQTSDWHV
jgi:hypothetical protein